MGSRHTHGMTDEARARWATRQFNNEMRLEARREWEASLPRHPWPEHRVKGEVVKAGEAPPEPERVEEIPARPWEGPLPTSAKSLYRAAQKAGYDVLATFSHQERKSNRELKVKEADVCAILGVRGGEKFIAEWEEIEGKWKVKKALVWAPHLAIQPSIMTVTNMKKEIIT